MDRLEAYGLSGAESSLGETGRKQKAPDAEHTGLLMDWSLAVPYFRTGNLHYHRR